MFLLIENAQKHNNYYRHLPTHRKRQYGVLVFVRMTKYVYRLVPDYIHVQYTVYTSTENSDKLHCLNPEHINAQKTS